MSLVAGVSWLLQKNRWILGVVHVETREGKLEKSWVICVGELLEAKSIHVCSYGSLKDGVKRRVLLNLYRTLGKRKLLISNRYTRLIEELCDYVT